MRWTVVLLTVAAMLGAPAGAAHAQDSRPLPGAPAAASVPAADSRAADEQTAVTVVDEFWRRYFADIGRRYESPRVAGGYPGSSGPLCGGEPTVIAGNALYCVAEDYLAWDEDLMDAGYGQIGDGWVYVVIAHEWAHAVQARLGRAGATTQTELQADCLAGAALQGAVDAELVRLEAGDDQELLRSLAAAADDGATTAATVTDGTTTDGVSHGTAAQRTSAFRTGADGGVDACL